MVLGFLVPLVSKRVQEAVGGRSGRMNAQRVTADAQAVPVVFVVVPALLVALGHVLVVQLAHVGLVLLALVDRVEDLAQLVLV